MTPLRSLKPLAGRLRPELLGRVRAARNRGDAVECPCCRGTFARFLSHRDRAGAKCPRCGALERHRVIWLYIQERTDLLTRRQSMLHVAPEYELQARLSRLAHLDYLSVDLDSPLAMEVADVTDFAYADDSFDVIFCNHVLEHVPDDRAALSELFRVLRPGGWAILLTPIDHDREATYEDPDVVTPEDRLREFGQEDHVRIYGRDYVARLEQAGFDVSVERFGEHLGEDVVRRFGLRRNGTIEELFVCSKALVASDVRVAPSLA
jgi:SAM-dependent methyltransferase